MKWIISYFHFSPVIFLSFHFFSYSGGGPMLHRLAHFSLSVRKSIPHGLYPLLNVSLSHPLSSCQMYKMVKKNDRLIYFFVLFIFIEKVFFVVFWWYFFFPTFRILCHQQSLIFTTFFSNIFLYYHDDYHSYSYCYW